MIPIEPFVVQIAKSTLDDLRQRLYNARWPDEIVDSQWEYGANLGYMKELADYWRTNFDWRAEEQRINKYAHYRASIDGLNIHFIHEHGKGRESVPLILSHGWPSSFFEMYKLIPLLTDPAGYGADPADSFDVIVPSLPGYGFSDAPTACGMTDSRIADLWARLMCDGLGYKRFGAHGSDWGASVTSHLALSYPNSVIGIHVTSVEMPHLGPGAQELSEAERAFLERREVWMQGEYGYGHLQRTRPQTLAYGLNDSPIGLAAWIVEKFRAWSDCRGDVEARFTKEEMLTSITIYWATQTIGSSMRLYYEHEHHSGMSKSRDRIRVPCAIALTREKVDRPPREWAERSYNVQQWTELPRGGHFIALEEPELLAQDIRRFFRSYR